MKHISYGRWYIDICRKRLGGRVGKIWGPQPHEVNPKIGIISDYFRCFRWLAHAWWWQWLYDKQIDFLSGRWIIIVHWRWHLRGENGKEMLISLSYKLWTMFFLTLAESLEVIRTSYHFSAAPWGSSAERPRTSWHLENAIRLPNKTCFQWYHRWKSWTEPLARVHWLYCEKFSNMYAYRIIDNCMIYYNIPLYYLYIIRYGYIHICTYIYVYIYIYFSFPFVLCPFALMSKFCKDH